jgi:hypothetical protein
MSLVALLRRRIAPAVAAAALLSAPLQTSAAERYPSHPVKIVVPFCRRRQHRLRGPASRQRSCLRPLGKASSSKTAPARPGRLASSA